VVVAVVRLRRRRENSTVSVVCIRVHKKVREGVRALL